MELESCGISFEIIPNVKGINCLFDDNLYRKNLRCYLKAVNNSTSADDFTKQLTLYTERKKNGVIWLKKLTKIRPGIPSIWFQENSTHEYSTHENSTQRKFHPRKFHPRKFHPRKFHPRKFHPAKIPPT